MLGVGRQHGQVVDAIEEHRASLPGS